MRTLIKSLFTILVGASLFVIPLAGTAISTPLFPGQTAASHQVWVLDQANLGAEEAGQLHIYNASSVGRLELDSVTDLGALAEGVGDGIGSRPHMIEFNRSGSHAIISNVASGHVYIMRTSDHQVVASIDVGQQAHHASAAANDQIILVAKQNDKKIGVIRTDYVFDMYSYNEREDLDLSWLEDRNNPDNAPICPVLAGNKVYVTLRGGGLYIVDIAQKPLHVIKAFSKDEIAPTGCGGVVANGSVYLNSGGASGAHLYVIDIETDELLVSKDLSHWSTDAHGIAKVGLGKYIWIAMRGAGDRVVVVDTILNVVVSTIEGIGTAPDLLAASPDGRWVYATLRGPNNLTGGPAAQGEMPGVTVLQVLDDGADGQFWGFYNIGALSADTPNDPHGIGVFKRSW